MKKVIVKYKNRNLYDLSKKAQITISELMGELLIGTKIKILKADDSEDITDDVFRKIINRLRREDTYSAEEANIIVANMSYERVPFIDAENFLIENL